MTKAYIKITGCDKVFDLSSGSLQTDKPDRYYKGTAIYSAEALLEEIEYLCLVRELSIDVSAYYTDEVDE